MTKIYFFYLSFLLTIIASPLAIGQVIVFEDKFDQYFSGQQIACQNPTVWTTWTGNPCNTTEDAYISNAFSFSGTNSVVIKQNNDIVRDHGLITSGVAEINFQVYIPIGKAGYFNTLANFAPPNYIWAMQAFFNAPGTGTLDAAGANAATFSYPQNQWFPVKVVADLSTNVGEFWLNGVKIHSWQWTLGTFGSPPIPLQLDGTDFYGNTVNDEMYIDDYNITHTSYTSKVSSTPAGGNWNSGSTWVGNVVPDQNTMIEIVSTATVNLDTDIIRDAETLVKGRLNCGTYNIYGTGDFVLSSNATLEIGSPLGISSSGASGNLQITGIRSLNPMANYIYDGSTALITGDGLPETINNLTINNSSGLTLSSSISVSGVLNLGNSSLITNTNTLSVGTSISNHGLLALTSGKVIGNFRRWLSNPAVTDALFPVGTSLTNYTPVNLNNIIGSGAFTVNAVSSKHPNASGTNVLQMYWKLTNSGIAATDLTFNYLDADVVGDETQYEIGRYNGGWVFPSPIILNTIANTARINGMNSFSDWTLGEPTALPVELSSFNANAIGKSVKLNWETSTEINNYGFEIERCAPSNECQPWEKIGFVIGNGNSNSPKYYSFVDDQIATGKYFYRLKQIDNDGAYSFSKSIELNLTELKKFELSQNYPNPFNPTTTISFALPISGNVKLTIFNLLGQEIETLANGFKEAGVYTFNFDAKILNSGIYLYKLEADGFTQTRKMTLVK